jgi:FixJ family two-component response regulator
MDSVERLLQLHGYSVRTFASTGSFLSYRLPSTPCCAIIDAEMPDCTARELQTWVTRTRPGLPIIQLTEHGNIPQAVQAIKDGAVDFLTKPIDDRGLIYSIQRAFVEEERLRPEREERALYEKRLATLTPREKEVCGLVVEGKLNKQIAAELGTCEKTVKVHRARVMRKMSVQSLPELVRVILKVSPPRPVIQAIAGSQSPPTVARL